MSEHIESAGWWSRAIRPSPGKRIAAASIAVALIAVTAGVWLSPSNPVSAAPRASDAEIKLAAENEQLRNSLDARESEVQALKSSQAKASTERKAAAEQGKANAAAEQAAAAAAGADKAAADRAAAAARSAAKAAAERAAASAKGKAQSAAARAQQAEADAARARASATTAGSGPAQPAPVVKPSALSLASLRDPQARLFGLYTPQAPFSWAETDAVAAQIGGAADSHRLLPGVGRTIPA